MENIVFTALIKTRNLAIILIKICNKKGYIPNTSNQFIFCNFAISMLFLFDIFLFYISFLMFRRDQKFIGFIFLIFSFFSYIYKFLLIS